MSKLGRAAPKARHVVHKARAFSRHTDDVRRLRSTAASSSSRRPSVSRRTPSSRARRRAPRSPTTMRSRPRARAREPSGRGPRRSPAPRPGASSLRALAPTARSRRMSSRSASWRKSWPLARSCEMPASAGPVSRFGAKRAAARSRASSASPQAPSLAKPASAALYVSGVRRRRPAAALAALAVDGADRAVDGRGLHLVEQPRRLGRLARREVAP